MVVLKSSYPAIIQRIALILFLASAYIWLNVAVVTSLAAQPAPTRENPGFTKNGIAGVTANTPFTVEAVRIALPGFKIVEQTRQIEGNSESYIIAVQNGQMVLEIDSYGSRVEIIGTRSPAIKGPHGFNVGMRFGDLKNKVPLQNECMRGAEESVYKVICTAKEGLIQYIVSIPYMAAREPEVWTLAMIQPELPLTELRWIAPEPDETAPVSASRPASDAVPASPSMMSVQKYLQQGDVLVKRAETAKALGYYLEAAKKGSARAYFNIGRLYETGNGVVQNPTGAIAYYDRAAKLGYIKALTRIIIVQENHKNIAGAVKTFYRYFRINPDAAVQDLKEWSGDIPRTVQIDLKSTGHYHGDIDGRLGPETRSAISAYLSGKPAARPTLAQPKRAGRGADNLAVKLQRQLQRTACYQGSIDGEWGSGSARAMRNFNHWAGRDLPIKTPTREALRAVTQERGAICGLD